MTASANPIQQSFERVAERCEDLTPLVYHRLFREHPEAQAMFRSERGELVKGSMLALTIEAILDFAGDRRGSFRLIDCEAASHDAYGTPRELFVAFFGDRGDLARGAGHRLVAGDRRGVAETAGRTQRCDRSAPSINAMALAEGLMPGACKASGANYPSVRNCPPPAAHAMTPSVTKTWQT